MRKTILSFILICLAAAVHAQSPDIRLETNIYQTSGATNSFTLILGAVPGKTGYCDVMCSGGNQSEAEVRTAVFNQETGGLDATYVSCQVDANGWVEVYLDEGVEIDYVSCEGAELTSFYMKHPETVEILALEHNALKSLDLSAYTNLSALYLKDNPFDVSPLIVGANKPNLQILDLSIIDNLDQNFDIKDYPNLQSFDAMSTHTLKTLTPSGCPALKKLSIDNTSVALLDVSQNAELRILNISETRIKKIDLTGCPLLEQFYATHSSAFNTDIKLSEIDLTCCPNLLYLFLNDNNLTTLDVSQNTYLQDLFVRNNYLTSLDLSNNPDLLNVMISGNCMDFNTLPLPKDTWLSYECKQRLFDVPEAYLKGSQLDLSAKVYREDSQTYAQIYAINEMNPAIESPVSEEWFTFENGVLTINELIPDSVYVSFYNPTFPDIELGTKMFLVKDETTFGKPDLVATLPNAIRQGEEVRLSVGIYGATPGNPKMFYVDFGDGNLVDYYTFSASTPAEPNVIFVKPRFGAIKIYMPESEKFTAFKISDVKLSGLDLTKAPHLRELSVNNAGLNNLDLQWNRGLLKLELTGNNFGPNLTLAGVNGYYGKNFLSHINLSNNNMTAVKLNEPGTWQYIDLSHNRLTEQNFTDADYLQYLDVSHNDFEYLKINYCGELKTLLCNDNKLSQIVMPETNVIEYFDCSNNLFSLANMPPRNGMDEAHFIYAPQAIIQIPTKGPGYNLSKQNVTIDGSKTVFTWKTVEGETLQEGVDYTCDGGITRFNDITIGKTLYCELSHPAYPQFSGDKVLKTSPMYSAGMPTHLLGSFTTPEGDQEVRLSMASAVENNAVYIDWTGTNSLEQYPLGTTYTVFSPLTTANAKVKVWSYDDVDNLTVFSLSGAKLKDVDLSPMHQLTSLSLNDAGLSGLVMPQSPNLVELSLENNNFTNFDFSTVPNLAYVSLTLNKLTSLDLTTAPNLQLGSFAANNISDVRFGNNDKLWSLTLTQNNISSLDLSGLPSMYQLFLNGNSLSSIDLSGMPELRVLYLDHNKFDFSNLPVPSEQWALYTYGDQEELHIECVDSKVDLSAQAERDGVPTTYTWFLGYPDYNPEDGTLTGEELYIDDEYTIDNGVTTFYTTLPGVCCVLTNTLFPDAYLQTNLIPVTDVNAIEAVAADNKQLSLSVNGRTITVNGAKDGAAFTAYAAGGSATAKAIAANGRAVMTVPAPGVYVIATNGAVAKVRVR